MAPIWKAGKAIVKTVDKHNRGVSNFLPWPFLQRELQ